VRSVSPHIARAGLLAVCGLLLVGAMAGCTTTQEKAARQQARSKRILEAREDKHDHKAKQQKKSRSHQR
jgi:Flp pilus assembly protein TadB